LAFLDITDPQKVILIGKLLSATDPSDWRDVKIYNNSGGTYNSGYVTILTQS